MAKQRFFILAKCYNKRGHLLSIGFNSYAKSHPIQKHFADLVGMPEKEYLHAEIAAIIRAKDKKIFRITIERYDSSGNCVNAKPCPICMRAIQANGIQIVEHTESLSNGFVSLRVG
jgi:deoxycytidylate deaminase